MCSYYCLCVCFTGIGFAVCSLVAVLAGGDVAALLLFAAIGRSSHGFSVFDFETFKTADPFIAGTLSCRLSNLVDFVQSYSVSLWVYAASAFVSNNICLCRV